MCGESWWVGAFPASRPGEALRDAFLKTFYEVGESREISFSVRETAAM